MDINFNGTNIVVEQDAPTLRVEMDEMSVELQLTSTELAIATGNPTVDVDVLSPQLLLPLTAGLMGSPPPLTQIWGETPGGTIDGINRSYATAHAYQPNLLAVFLNGLRQRRSQDYNETGSQSFSFLNAPLPGDSLSIDYIQS